MSGLTLPRRMVRAMAVLAAVAALSAAPASAQDRPRVVAVNYALGYFAERLGGGDVDVVFPVPVGVDPPFWRPGIADISAMQTAELVLLNGAGFATWTTKASLPRSRLIDTSRGFADRYIATATVTHSHGTGGEHSHAGTASYTWLDQELAAEQAGAIAAAMEARGLVAPADAADRLDALTRDLLALDTAAEGLRALAAGRVLIATHPRYQYLARAYGLDIRALEWEAGAAPDAGQLAELAALAAETGAKVLLWESAPPAEARAAVRDLGLADLEFPTLATVPEGGDYLAAFGGAIAELSGVLTATGE